MPVLLPYPPRPGPPYLLLSVGEGGDYCISDLSRNWRGKCVYCRQYTGKEGGTDDDEIQVNTQRSDATPCVDSIQYPLYFGTSVELGQ